MRAVGVFFFKSKAELSVESEEERSGNGWGQKEESQIDHAR